MARAPLRFVTVHQIETTRNTLATTAVLFSIMLAHALLETARDALFLSTLGPDLLALAYIAIAITALAAIALVRWIGVRDPRHMLQDFLVAATLGTAVLALLIDRAGWITFVLYVWTGLTATLVVPAYWTMVDRSLHVAGAKRAFATIGAGGILGALTGSVLATALSRWLPATQLVTAGAGALGIAMLASYVVSPRPHADQTRAHPRALTAADPAPSRRYGRLLLVAAVISTITLTLGDLTFKRALAHRLPDEDLATAFGVIYTWLNVIALAVQVVLAPRLIARRGIGVAMTVLPLAVVITSFGFALTGATIAILALKLCDGGMRHSLHRMTSEILFFALPTEVRDARKPAIDVVGQRGGQALAALIVLAAVALDARLSSFATLTMVFGGLWFFVVLTVRRAYVAQFRARLEASDLRPRAAVETHRPAPPLVTVNVPRLIAMLDDVKMRGEARAALVACGTPALDELIGSLENPQTRASIRRQLPRTVGRFGTERAAAALVRQLPQELDGITEFKLLRALGRLRSDEPGLPVNSDTIGAYADREILAAHNYAHLATRLAGEPDPSGSLALLRELLAEKRQHCGEHAFRALGILEPRSGLRGVYNALISGDPQRQAEAQEILDATIAPDLREALLGALLDPPDEPPPHPLDELARSREVSGALKTLLAHPSESLSSITAHYIGERHMMRLRGELERLHAVTASPLVELAFDQALARLHA